MFPFMFTRSKWMYYFHSRVNRSIKDRPSRANQNNKSLNYRRKPNWNFKVSNWTLRTKHFADWTNAPFYRDIVSNQMPSESTCTSQLSIAVSHISLGH